MNLLPQHYQRYSKHFEIRWTGLVSITTDASGVRPGAIPRGGRHVHSRKEAEKLLENFYERCGPRCASLVSQLHKPRIVEVEHGHDELG